MIRIQNSVWIYPNISDLYFSPYKTEPLSRFEKLTQNQYKIIKVFNTKLKLNNIETHL